MREFLDIELAYAQFNRLRTLKTLCEKPLDIFIMPSGVVIKDTLIPSNNRIIVHTCSDWGHIAQLLKHFDASSEPPFIEIQAKNVTEDIRAGFKAINYSHSFDWRFLKLDLDEESENLITKKTQSNPGINVSHWDSKRVDDFLSLLKLSGLECSDEIWQIKKRFYCTSTFLTFIASIHSQPIAWSTMYQYESFGICANAFTLPEFRNLGVQTSLLEARKEKAKEYGLTSLLSDVIAGSVSERNCLKVGFKEIYTRQCWQFVN